MRKVILSSTIIIIIAILVSCGNNTNSSEINNNDKTVNDNLYLNKENEDKNILTKEDIKALNTAESDTMFITEKGSEIVTGNINLKNAKFNGDLTIINSKDEKKFISLYINNIQTDFILNNKRAKVHEVDLKKGENNFNIVIDENLKYNINESVLLTSSVDISNDLVAVQYIGFNLKDDSKKENFKRDFKTKNIISYKYLPKTQELVDEDIIFSYYNLSLNDYMNKDYNKSSKIIKATVNENLEIPIILSKNSVNENANIKVIINGIEIYSGYLDQTLQSDVYIPLNFNAPKDKGEYIMNIVIFDKFNNQITTSSSNDFKLEVN